MCPALSYLNSLWPGIGSTLHYRHDPDAGMNAKVKCASTRGTRAACGLVRAAGTGHTPRPRIHLHHEPFLEVLAARRPCRARRHDESGWHAASTHATTNAPSSAPGVAATHPPTAIPTTTRGGQIHGVRLAPCLRTITSRMVVAGEPRNGLQFAGYPRKGRGHERSRTVPAGVQPPCWSHAVLSCVSRFRQGHGVWGVPVCRLVRA